MRGILLPLGIAAALLVCLLHVAPAQAQALRTWVSGVGDDANPCNRTAPCKTFIGALSKTAVDGEIDCLDPAGFGTLTITQSITIDCHQTLGSILHSGTNGINIAFDSFGSAPREIRYIVRLRGLSLNGADAGVIGIRITGGAVHPGGLVFIEDTVIDGDFGGVGRGISDERTGGGGLNITNTTVRNTADSGIVISGGGVSSQRIQATLQNVRVQNSETGVAVSNGATVMIDNSTFTGNTNDGVYGDGPINPSYVNVSNSVMSNNGGNGVINNGGSTIQLSNNDITFNNSGISGTTFSYSNNRIAGNTTAGTAPTSINPPSTNPSGMQ
jgi:parallel beta helix pectate lyase-like protein